MFVLITMWFIASLFALIICGVIAIVAAISHRSTKRRWGRRCAVSASCAIVGLIIILSSGCNGNHEWQEATCTEPKTCINCGVTEGESLGHAYKTVTTDPSCTEDGHVVTTCSICGDSTEESLKATGHSVDSWQIVTEPSCTTEGEKAGICKVCGAEFKQTIQKTLHTEGEWVIAEPATPTTPGKKSLNCSVCGESMKTEEYELSGEEIKAYCKSYSYEEIARRPDDYKGEYAKFTGKVVQVMENSLFSTTSYTLRVNVTVDKWGYYDDTIYVSYTASAGDSRILEDDIITMYGYLTGTKTYETVLGSTLTIPSFTAKYIELKN